MDILTRNLDAMMRHSPASAALIAAAQIPADFLLVSGSDGSATFLRNTGAELEWLGGTSMPAASANALTTSLIPGTGNGLGLSIGSGYEWAAFLKKLGSAQPLYVYEPEAIRLKMALTVCDVSEDLASGKLIVLTGSAEAADDELRAFLAKNPGFEPPAVMHPLATIAGARRHSLLAAGEMIVRRAIEARHVMVSQLATNLHGQAAPSPTASDAAMLVTERYPGERPLHAVVSSMAPAPPRLVLDHHASCSMAGRLEFLITHQPGRILSDLFRAELACIPGHVAVHTFIPPLVGGGLWQPGRLPAAATFSPLDKVIVHAQAQQVLLEAHGLAKSQIEMRPLLMPAPMGAPAAADSPARLVLIADLPRSDTASLGIELPTHQAVYAAAAEMIAAEYLSVNFHSAADILRRALLKAGVRVPTSDPALQDPMLRMVRDVLIPALPVLTLARLLVDQKMPLQLVGDWPNLERAASPSLALTPFAEFCAAADRWKGVATVVHLSPWGTVSPLVLEAATRGVKVVAPRHPSDAYGGALPGLLGSSQLVRPEPKQLLPVLKSALARRSGNAGG